MSVDQQMLKWIARHGVATAGDLALLHGLSDSVAQDTLEQLTAAGLLGRFGLLAGEPLLYAATRRGLRVCGLAGLKLCEPSALLEAHMRAVASCAVWLELEHQGDCELLSERELARAHGGQDDWVLRAPLVREGGQRLKRPDLLLKPRSAALGLPLAVEIELTVKSAERLYSICVGWRNCASLAGVLYLVAPAVLRPLLCAVHAAGAADRITVVALAAADVPSLRRRALLQPIERLPAEVIASASITPRPSTGMAGKEQRGTSAGTCPRKQHKREADAVSDGLQLALLRWCGRHGIVTLDSFAVHMQCTEQDLLPATAKLHTLGYLRAGSFLRGEGLLLWATRRGLSRCGLSRLKTYKPSMATASQLIQLARIGAFLELELPGCRSIGMRELPIHPGFLHPEQAARGSEAKGLPHCCTQAGPAHSGTGAHLLVTNATTALVQSRILAGVFLQSRGAVGAWLRAVAGWVEQFDQPPALLLFVRPRSINFIRRAVSALDIEAELRLYPEQRGESAALTQSRQV